MIAGGWLVAYVAGSRVLFLMTYGCAILLIALPFLGRRRPKITAHRSRLPTRIREGQTIDVELAITGRARGGTILLEERLARLAPPVRLLVGALGDDLGAQYSYSITPALRGEYAIGPLTAVWSDPFGLTRRRVELINAETVLVHPSVESVHDRVLAREWEDPPIRPPVSKPWPTGFEFYGMRDYVSGDDPRRIVWRAVARTGRYLVREAEQGITDRVTIILDDQARAHTSGEPSETFETAIRAVASIGVRHLGDGFVIGVEASSGSLARALRGPRARLGLLDALARARPGHEPLIAALRRVLADPRRDAHHILVTPHLDHAAAKVIRLMLDRGGSMTFVHVVTDESDPESLARASVLGCEMVELASGAPLEKVFRRGVGAGMRR